MPHSRRRSRNTFRRPDSNFQSSLDTRLAQSARSRLRTSQSLRRDTRDQVGRILSNFESFRDKAVSRASAFGENREATRIQEVGADRALKERRVATEERTGASDISLGKREADRLDIRGKILNQLTGAQTASFRGTEGREQEEFNIGVPLFEQDVRKRLKKPSQGQANILRIGKNIGGELGDEFIQRFQQFE